VAGNLADVHSQSLEFAGRTKHEAPEPDWSWNMNAKAMQSPRGKPTIMRLLVFLPAVSLLAGCATTSDHLLDRALAPYDNSKFFIESYSGPMPRLTPFTASPEEVTKNCVDEYNEYNKAWEEACRMCIPPVKWSHKQITSYKIIEKRSVQMHSVRYGLVLKTNAGRKVLLVQVWNDNELKKSLWGVILDEKDIE
jgi:hypothetical protein